MIRALPLVLLLTACSSVPTPLELAYNAKLEEAKADCQAKGGDEFKPYGSIAWLDLFVTKKMPMVFRCQRLEKHWKRGVAVYAFRVQGETISMEVR